MSKPFAYPWDRVKPYKFYHIGMLICLIIKATMYRTRVVGRENLPKSASGVIIACNHVNAIDPGFLVAATRMRWRFIGKKELFEKKLVATLFTHCNGFPLDRDIVDRRALDFALAAMREGGYGLGIFPEGTRSLDGVPHEGKAGVSVLARRTKADILPCSIYHEFPLKRGAAVTVRIGEVIPFAELGLGETPNKRQNQAACEKIMGAISELWNQGHG
ncbi:MAG: 1-acyl-sn-glycerol-3-phosphate acyltransferase [Oscillospiraceae bacterium]|jgi:1-acyl-sn-glycerol-3-phosphate acyltransferase|nr:1-acyl-sn-glycerol-3-phosphate acyltransferase [Oscillospiraceae bacterium]